MILTLDLGTSTTKAALWEPGGAVGVAEVTLTTRRPEPGAQEQDPADWWRSVVAACEALATRVPGGLAAVEAVSLTGARQTFGLFDAAGVPTGPGLLWSDCRPARRRPGGRHPAPDRPGVPGEAAYLPARLAWMSVHHPDRLERAAWILAPRDAVAWRLTGSVSTDPTFASLTGCYAADGTVAADLPGPLAEWLPPVAPSDRVTGTTGPAVATELGLPTGTPVVIGAGDRQCEVVGTGATTAVPVVGWGTTANVSLPVGDRSDPAPSGVVVTRAADGGWQLEGGLSAAGSFLAWLGRLCGRSPSELAALAVTSPPGARGVTAVPWLDGARAPWWRPDAGAAFTGLSDASGPADLARAVVESVARDIQRCLEAMATRHRAAAVTGLGLAGAGSVAVWVEILTAVTGLPARRRRSGQAASAGAALLAAGAVGQPWDLDDLDPVVAVTDPDPAAVARYVALAGPAGRVATALVTLGHPPPCE